LLQAILCNATFLSTTKIEHSSPGPRPDPRPANLLANGAGSFSTHFSHAFPILPLADAQISSCVQALLTTVNKGSRELVGFNVWYRDVRPSEFMACRTLNANFHHWPGKHEAATTSRNKLYDSFTVSNVVAQWANHPISHFAAWICSILLTK